MKTKEQIIAELAKSVGISPEKCEAVLGELNRMVYREAENGFEIPALCKFQIIKLSAQPARAPLAGGQTEIKERKLLKVDALKEARDAILAPPAIAVQPVSPPVAEEIKTPVIETPAEEIVRQVPVEAEKEEIAPEPEPVRLDLQQISAEEAGEVPIPEPAKEAPAAEYVAVAVEEPQPPVVSAVEGEEPEIVIEEEPAEIAGAPSAIEMAEPVPGKAAPIIFKCESCGNAVEAPGDMAGMDGECPFCGMIVKIPAAVPEKLENLFLFDPIAKSQLPHNTDPFGASAGLSTKRTPASLPPMPVDISAGLPAKSAPTPLPQKPQKQSPYVALDTTIRIDLPAEILNPHQEIDRKKVFIKRR